MRTASRSFIVMALLLTATAAGAQAGAAAAPPPAPGVPSSHATRLFIGSTGRALAPGEGYVVFHGALVPSFQVGVTDRVSMGAGSVYLAGGNFWITPKVQLVRSGTRQLAVGAVHFVLPGEGQFGVAFLSHTRDIGRGGVTIGAGAAYTSGWEADDAWAVGGPLILVGGDWQMSRRAAFISENYVVLVEGALLMNGFRWSWGRFSLDLALLVFAGEGGVAGGGPMLNLAWRFE